MTEQAQQPIILDLRMTVDGLNFTLGQLAKAPFEQVSDLISDLRTQALTQLEALKAEVTREQIAENVMPHHVDTTETEGAE